MRMGGLICDLEKKKNNSKIAQGSEEHERKLKLLQQGVCQLTEQRQPSRRCDQWTGRATRDNGVKGELDLEEDDQNQSPSLHNS